MLLKTGLCQWTFTNLQEFIEGSVIHGKFEYKKILKFINLGMDVESTFSEIIVPNGKNIIVGCVYKHHTIDANEFEKLLLPTLRKANKEKKPVIIAGDQIFMFHNNTTIPPIILYI